MPFGNQFAQAGVVGRREMLPNVPAQARGTRLRQPHTGRNLPSDYGRLRRETQKSRGRRYATLSVQSRSDPVISSAACSYSMGTVQQTRNPMKP